MKSTNGITTSHENTYMIVDVGYLTQSSNLTVLTEFVIIMHVNKTRKLIQRLYVYGTI